MALDRITKSLLETFVSGEGFSNLDQASAFERFATYSILSREHPETFNVEDFIVSGGGDLGIDGLAVIVNGSLITSVEELEDLLESSGYLEAAFIFVQAKTSTSFEASEIGNFCTGVRDFFSESPAFPRNGSISAAEQLQKAIYDNSARFRKGNPYCRLYYVCPGNWTGDEHLGGIGETPAPTPGGGGRGALRRPRSAE